MIQKDKKSQQKRKIKNKTNKSPTQRLIHLVEYICIMTFIQRLTRYFIGITIGLVVVAMMFPNRDWLTWTPQSRMMQDIREFKVDISPTAHCSMTCADVTIEHLQDARQNGKVNFEKSNPQITPKMYQLEYGNLAFELALFDSTFTLQSVHRAAKTCTCP